MTVMDARWTNPSAAWVLKIARARKHRAELDIAAGAYLRTGPYRLDESPGEHEHTTDITFRIVEPVPPELSVMVGDVLHNLRSALDAFAFELACSHFGPSLEDNETVRRASAFPIVLSQEELLLWFQRGGKARAALFGMRELEALHWAQSSYWSDEAARVTGTPRDMAQAEAFDPLSRLERLHNMDKHRRLAVAAYSLDLLSWGTNGDLPTARRVFDVPRPPWSDGQRVAVVYDPPSEAEDQPLQWQLQLGLTDDLPDQALDAALGSMDQAVEGAIQGALQALERRGGA
jgi:hypothetical protein